jgi:hypothetical protein
MRVYNYALAFIQWAHSTAVAHNSTYNSQSHITIVSDPQITRHTSSTHLYTSLLFLNTPFPLITSSLT